MQMFQDVPDHIKYGLKILFVGFNPGLQSGEKGHHYSHPSNRFYKLLHLAGLTPRLYSPFEDYTFLDLGYGLTNIVGRTTKAADEIKKEEYQLGAKLLMLKIEQYKPKVACFVGKRVYQEYSRRQKLEWGEQPKPIVEGVVDYVAPSSSGLVRIPFDEQVEIYRGLQKYI